MTKLVIVIPARYQSSRFPGKPLYLFGNKSMLQLVWEKCINSIDKKNVYVATDDKRIQEHCLKNKMQVIMTSKKCKTGTDRIYEFSKKINSDLYINVQGDEPMIRSLDIKKFIDFSLLHKDTIVNAMTDVSDLYEFKNLNVPKVVYDLENNLIYMSRSPIPGSKKNNFLKAKKQVCIYSFPKNSLKKFGLKRKKTFFENIEDIEILRFLEMGEKIKMFQLKEGTIAVDTIEDAKKVGKLIKNEK